MRLHEHIVENVYDELEASEDVFQRLLRQRSERQLERAQSLSTLSWCLDALELGDPTVITGDLAPRPEPTRRRLKRTNSAPSRRKSTKNLNGCGIGGGGGGWADLDTMQGAGSTSAAQEHSTGGGGVDIGRVFARQLTCYKAVALVRDSGDNLRFFSIYDGTTEYELGKPMTGSGGAGFFCYARPLEAAEASLPRHSKLGSATRVVLRCLVSGNGWRKGNKLSFPHITPVGVVTNFEEQGEQPGSASFVNSLGR